MYNYIFLSWDTVDNVSNYSVYYQQEGKKTKQTGSFPQSPGYVFESANTNPSIPIKVNGIDRDIDRIITYATRRSVTGNNTSAAGDFILAEHTVLEYGLRLVIM